VHTTLLHAFAVSYGTEPPLRFVRRPPKSSVSDAAISRRAAALQPELRAATGLALSVSLLRLLCGWSVPLPATRTLSGHCSTVSTRRICATGASDFERAAGSTTGAGPSRQTDRLHTDFRPRRCGGRASRPSRRPRSRREEQKRAHRERSSVGSTQTNNREEGHCVCTTDQPSAAPDVTFRSSSLDASFAVDQPGAASHHAGAGMRRVPQEPIFLHSVATIPPRAGRRGCDSKLLVDLMLILRSCACSQKIRVASPDTPRGVLSQPSCIRALCTR
jgi:hypothetical protein